MVRHTLGNKCKVNSCTRKHDFHYCKYCKEFDSDHYSFRCPRRHAVRRRQRRYRGYCRVRNCTQTHRKHYCKVCHNHDSDHQASDCHLGTLLFHGTSYSAAISIQRSGFRPSAAGNLGPGVYFTDNYKDAAKISKRWGTTFPSAVIECRLEKDPNHVNHGIHGRWYTDGDFTEYVVRQAHLRRVKIVKIYRID